MNTRHLFYTMALTTNFFVQALGVVLSTIKLHCTSFHIIPLNCGQAFWFS